MHPCAQAVNSYILGDSSDLTDSGLNPAALLLFDYQYRNNAPYRRLCDSQGKNPGVVEHWRDIPAVPAAAFKAFDLSCAAPEEIVKVFHSSGTTASSASRHFLSADALALYELSLSRGFTDVFGERGERLLWALMPPPEQAPHSSLSHMLATLGADRFFWDDLPTLRRALETLREPVTLFGTAFAFVQLLDSDEACWPLPPGSIVIETGGFKGRVKEVSREELYGSLSARFAVPVTDCHAEYGMSEMASQYYGHGLDPVKRGPRWVRTRAIDPETGLDTGPGAPGILRHYDLANFNSALVLDSEDYGYMAKGGFVLLGRAPGAEARGCSLTVEELG